MVANQHSGLRQKQLSKRILVTLNFTVVPPGQVGHVGNKRYVSVVGRDARDGADVLRAADKTDLDGRHRHVFEGRPGLVRNRLFVEREVVKNLGCVAHVSAGHDSQRMGPGGDHGGDVGCQAASPAGVVGVEGHHAHRVGAFLLGEKGFRVVWRGVGDGHSLGFCGRRR